MKKTNILRLVMGALFAALVFIATSIFPIPIASTAGYIHLGDMIIYLAACLLPAPYAILAAVIGAGLADALVAPVYILGTVIVKALLALTFSSKTDRILQKRNVIAPIVCVFITVIGYSVYDMILFSSFEAGLIGLFMNFIQASSSALLFYIVAAALDRFGLKKKIWRKV